MGSQDQSRRNGGGAAWTRSKDLSKKPATAKTHLESKASADTTLITLDQFSIGPADHSPPCTLKPFLDSLTPTEVVTIKAVMANRQYEAAAIWKVLHARGYPYSAQVIRRHRREGCAQCQINPVPNH